LGAQEIARLGDLALGLQCLALYTLGWPNILDNMTSIADAELKQVVSRFPGLEELELLFDGQFSRDALRMVGHQCQQLRILKAHLPCDIAALERSTEMMLFPKLGCLDVDFLEDYQECRR
jgi:hypothetical protein